MRDDDERGDRIKDLGPMELYLAKVERRVRPVTEEDIKKGLNIENLVIYDGLKDILKPGSDEDVKTIAKKFVDAFFEGPLASWLNKARN
jgi:hypothetical protein